MNGRRVITGWFALIVAYTALTQSDKIAGLLGTTTAATRRLSDPSVPLIPDPKVAQQQKQSSGGSTATNHLAELNALVPPA